MITLKINDQAPIFTAKDQNGVKRILFKMKNLIRIIVVLILISGILISLTNYLFGPVTKNSNPIVFIVPEKTEGFDEVSQLRLQRIIKNETMFQWLLNIIVKNKKIQAGGYRVNQNMFAWQVLQKLLENPDFVWVTIPEGLRKEQIAEIFANKLNWNDAKVNQWIKQDTTKTQDYFEGVYFPDTYLLPKDETGEQITQRLINNFNEKMQPLFPQFTEKNIKWTTGIKIASLIQREAAGPQDMKLISGIIWNRLNQGIKLQIDATMQYTKGKQDKGWWGNIDLSEKTADSLYNTYLYKGLPPTPICNPGLFAIEAALNPEETSCIYYLHDKNKQIHCAKTYLQHQANIEKYLH